MNHKDFLLIALIAVGFIIYGIFSVVIIMEYADDTSTDIYFVSYHFQKGNNWGFGNILIDYKAARPFNVTGVTQFIEERSDHDVVIINWKKMESQT